MKRIQRIARAGMAVLAAAALALAAAGCTDEDTYGIAGSGDVLEEDGAAY